MHSIALHKKQIQNLSDLKNKRLMVAPRFSGSSLGWAWWHCFMSGMSGPASKILAAMRSVLCFSHPPCTSGHQGRVLLMKDGTGAAEQAKPHRHIENLCAPLLIFHCQDQVT